MFLNFSSIQKMIKNHLIGYFFFMKTTKNELTMVTLNYCMSEENESVIEVISRVKELLSLTI